MINSSPDRTFNICNLSRNFFGEIAETMKFGLDRLGFTTHLNENAIMNGAVNIIFGAHLIEQVDVIPPDAIIFNLEQLASGTAVLSNGYKKMLGIHPIFDYSGQNIDFLKSTGLSKNPQKVGIGFNPSHQRILPSEQDIDVLFYGVVSPRRARILDALTRSGLNVRVLTGVFGRELDIYIARSKVILNVHCYETHIFEIIRASYLLNNAKAIVTEFHADTDIDPELREAVSCAAYDEIVVACQYLVSNDDARHALETRAHALFSQRSQAEYLKIPLRELGLI